MEQKQSLAIGSHGHKRFSPVRALLWVEIPSVARPSVASRFFRNRPNASAPTWVTSAVGMPSAVVQSRSYRGRRRRDGAGTARHLRQPTRSLGK